MPTGYTAKIANGITFHEFALDCARAFGACVMMRDEPGGGESIPDKFEESAFYADRAAAAVDRLAALEQMPVVQMITESDKHNADTQAAYIKALRKDDELLAKYRAMLAAAKAWTPPSPEHDELKAFMISQIEQSIRFDCSHHELAPSPLSPAQWYKRELDKARHDVEYYTEEAKKERERVAGRNLWIARLRESLSAAKAGEGE